MQYAQAIQTRENILVYKCLHVTYMYMHVHVEGQTTCTCTVYKRLDEGKFSLTMCESLAAARKERMASTSSHEMSDITYSFRSTWYGDGQNRMMS